MGSGKRLIVSASGFPGTTETWRFIQNAWREPLNALALLAGEKVIVSGLIQTGNAVSDGFVSFGGAIYPFVGGTIQSTVTLVKQVVNSTYDADLDNDGQQDSLPQYETAFFQFGSSGTTTFLFSNLTRLKTIQELSNFSLPPGVVVDPNYIPLTQALISALTNVQADWNVVNNESDSYINNKPSLFKPLKIGTSLLGDFPTETDSKRVISFPTINTANYIVVGSLVSANNEWNINNDVIWTIGAKTATSFELLGREVSPNTQNMRFDYMIISNSTSIRDGVLLPTTILI